MPRAIPKRWLILIAVMLAFTPIVIDMTILHIAVPSLTQALGASSTEVLWIIDIYPLLMAGLLVPMGTLADRVGSRRILLGGLSVFGMASVLAAFAPTPALLIGARVLLAMGGAMIMPCVLGIIRRTFEDERERAMALGLWGTVGAAGAALGPLIGGALLEHFWWGSVFLINVPIMAVVIPVAVLLLPCTETTTPGKWPIGQALILIAGIIAFVYGIKSGIGGTQPLVVVVPVLALSLALLTVFARQQLRTTTPMLDLSLFAHPVLIAGLIMALVSIGALTGVELTLAMELQYVLDKTPLQAGVFMIPIMLAAAMGGPVAGYLSNRFGLRVVASLSLVVSAGALAYLAFADFFTPGIRVPTVLAVLGLALSIGLTASSIAIMGAVEASKGSAAGALEATAYELGTGLGITFFGMFMARVYGRSINLLDGLSPSLTERAASSIGDSYVVAAALPAEQASTLVEAAKMAFLNTHSILLSTSAVLIGALAMVVFILIGRAR
ncbi:MULTISPECIES: MFS transporter [Pseudomonas]|uniref:MFS transporter n=1 Tax=Pseudomonas TaxID=286 RepID=UPI00398FEF68